jgi:hypothetical protein
MNKIKTTVTAVAMGAALALGTVACGVTADDRNGDPGKIVEKDHDANGKRADDYDFVIKRADGSTYEKDVTGSAFKSCYVGSSYPGCLED